MQEERELNVIPPEGYEIDRETQPLSASNSNQLKKDGEIKILQ